MDKTKTHHVDTYGVGDLVYTYNKGRIVSSSTPLIVGMGGKAQIGTFSAHPFFFFFWVTRGFVW